MFGFGGQTGDTPVSQIISLVFTLLIVAIFVRAILSWFNMDPRSPLVQACIDDYRAGRRYPLDLIREFE